jgi:hypothetical protein
LTGDVFPCLGGQAGSELEAATNATGKIARAIVHPCPAIDPTTHSIFGTVDFERINGAARISERHHGFKKPGDGLTDALDRSLRSKLIDLRTGIGLIGFDHRAEKSDDQQET